MKLHELTEDTWEDAESRRTTPNPLPVADSETLNHVFDLAEELDDKILADAKTRTSLTLQKSWTIKYWRTLKHAGLNLMVYAR